MHFLDECLLVEIPSLAIFCTSPSESGARQEVVKHNGQRKKLSKAISRVLYDDESIRFLIGGYDTV